MEEHIEGAGFHFWEYLLVVSPDEKVQLDVKKYKEEFARDYDFPGALKSIPHITVARFFQYPSYHLLIKDRLRKIGSYISPFEVYLRDFNKFANQSKNVIFINVESELGRDHKEILELSKKLRPGLKDIVIPKGRFFTSKPHLTVARGIPPEKFNTAWSGWATKKYFNKFTARDIVLLGRPVSRPPLKYELMDRVPLLGLNKPRDIREGIQGELF